MCHVLSATHSNRLRGLKGVHQASDYFDTPAPSMFWEDIFYSFTCMYPVSRVFRVCLAVWIASRSCTQ